MRILRLTLPSIFLLGLLHLSFAQGFKASGNQLLIARGTASKELILNGKLAKNESNSYKNAVSGTGVTKMLAPTANDDVATTNEDSNVSIDILTNDTGGAVALTIDFDAATLGYQSSITTAEGTFTADIAGNVVFSPVADFYGTASAQYTVSDMLLQESNPAQITVTVNPVDDPPNTNPDTQTTNEDQQVDIAVLTNDSDIDDPIDPATVDLNMTLSGVQGTVTITEGTFTNNAGIVTFVPTPNFFGTATTNYTVNDNAGLTSNASQIKVTIISVNDAPLAVADATATNEDTPVSISVVANDSDVENGLNAGSVDLDPAVSGSQTTKTVTEGVFAVDGTGLVTFTPNANYFGSATCNYTVSDNLGAISNIVSITITINSVNDPPSAVDDATVTDENVPVDLNIITNDSDVEGGLVASSVDLDLGTLGQQTTKTNGGGTFTVNASGLVHFVPTTNFIGTASLQYVVSDNLGATSAPATISITVNFVNQPPVANDDNVSTNEDTPVTINVTANDTNDGLYDLSSVDLDPSTAGIQSTLSTTDGNYTVNTSTGVVTFVPTANTFGATSITYTVKDNLGLMSNVATITVNVISVNDAPVAVSDATSTNEDVTVSLNVTTNDTDIDGTINTGSVDLDLSLAGQQTTKVVTLGTFSVSALGLVSFVPNANQSGTASTTYTVNDNSGAVSNSATITITINAVNDPPIAADDATSTNEDTPTTIKVVSNDSDPEGSLAVNTVDLDVSTSGIQASITNGDGTYTVNPAGVVSYTPAPDVNGTMTLQYTVNDTGGATSNAATITITVIAVNDAPFITAQITNPLVTNEEQAITISLSDLKVTDPDDSYPADFTLSVSPGAGYTVSGTTVTPNTNVTGTLSVGVRVNDGSLSSNLFSLQVRVDNVNDPPVITGQHPLSVTEDTPITLQLTDLIVNDIDNPGYPTGFSMTVSPGTNYTVSGTTVTPDANITTTLSVPVTVNDGTNNSATFNVQITINKVNDVPLITAQTPISVGEAQPVTISLSQITVFDPDNNFPADFTLFVLSGSDYSVSGNVVTPNSTFSGTLKVKIFVSDGAASSPIYDLQIQVNSVNDPPVITGQQSLSVNEDSPITIQLTNLSVNDPDNNYPTDFTLTVLPGTNYTFSGNTVTPVTDFPFSATPNTITVKVKVNDGLADSAPFNLIVTVQPVNDAPNITNQQPLSTNEDTPITLQFSNLIVTDPDNSYPTGFSILVGTGSNYTMSGTTITPSADYNGPLSVPVRVSDGSLTSSIYNVQITVNPVNDAPVIKSQAALSTQENTAITIKLTDLVVSDGDSPGYPTGFTLSVGSGANYTASGTTVTPAADYDGPLNVPITVSDGSLSSAIFTLQITVTPVNTPPLIKSQAPLNTPEDQAITLQLSNFTVQDPDNNYPTGFTMNVSPGANYTVSGTTITPGPDYYGPLTVPITVNDGISNSPVFNAQITVTAVNDAPAIKSQAALSVNEDNAITIQLANLTVLDPDNNYPTGFSLVVSPGANYTLSGNVVTPSANYYGPLSVPVRVSDGSALSNTFNVQITVVPVNDGPTTAGLPAVSLQEDNTAQQTVSLLNGFKDIEDAPSAFSYTIVSNTNASFFQSISIDQPTGNLLFTLKPNVFGAANVTVKMTDTGGLSVQDVVAITINAVNDPPSFDPIADIVIFENAGLQTVTVTNISAGPLETQSLLLSAVSSNTSLIPQPTINYNGTGASGTITFTPVASQTGTAIITVKLVDTGLAEFTQTFQVQVNSINDAPTLDPLSNVTMLEDAALQSINLNGITAGPSESQVLTVIATSNNPSLFEVLAVDYTSPLTTGTLSLKPKANAFGTAVITVTVTDDGPSTPPPNKNSITRTFNVAVQSVNDLPVANDDNQATNEDITTSFDVVGNDTDVDGTVNVASVDLDVSTAGVQNTKNLAQGKFTVNAAGTVTFVPTPDYNGVVTLDYTVTDNVGGVSLPGTITVTVISVNDTPTLATISNVTVLEDVAQQIVALSGITAGGGENQTLTVTVSTTNTGLFEVLETVYTSAQTTGSVKFKPKANMNGTATVTVTVTDSGTGSNTVSKTFTITVQPVNDPPVFISTPVTIAVLGRPYKYTVQVTDPDTLQNDNVVIKLVGGFPAWATLTMSQKDTKHKDLYQADIQGVPPTGGTITVAVDATDKASVHVAQNYQLYIDTPPVVNAISINVDEDADLGFTQDHFTSVFTDVNGDKISKVKFLTLPRHGTLSNNGVVVNANDEMELGAVSSLIYRAYADYNGLDTLIWNASDGIAYANESASINIVVKPINDPPKVSIESDSLLYQIGIGAIPFTDSLKIEDIDNDSLQNAEIGFRQQNFDAINDILSFTSKNNSNITGIYNAQAGVLTLTGKAPLTEYVDAIKSVLYLYDKSSKPANDLKTIYVSVGDGQASSETKDRLVRLIYTFEDIGIVTGFTPNGDGVNDVWQVIKEERELDLEGSKLFVYDKRGVLVFHSVGFNSPWNGKYKGELLPSDSYFYTIDIVDSKLPSLKKSYKGTVTILH